MIDYIPAELLLPPSSFLLPPSCFLLPPSSFLLPPSSFLLPPSSFLLPASCFPWPHSHFGTHPTLVPQKIAPFFSCAYVEPILQPLCFQIHACNGGVLPSSMLRPSNVSACLQSIPFLFNSFWTLLHNGRSSTLLQSIRYAHFSSRRGVYESVWQLQVVATNCARPTTLSQYVVVATNKNRVPTQTRVPPPSIFFSPPPAARAPQFLAPASREALP